MPRKEHESPPHKYSSSPEVAAVIIIGRFAALSESRIAEVAEFSQDERVSSFSGLNASMPENGSHIITALLEPKRVTMYFRSSL